MFSFITQPLQFVYVDRHANHVYFYNQFRIILCNLTFVHFLSVEFYSSVSLFSYCFYILFSILI